MKKISLLCLSFACAGLISCKNEEKKQEKLEEEKPLSVACYQALYENDTISLTINTLKDDKISGKMVMKVEGNPTNDGEIKGEMKGDTLYADYSFVNEKNKQIFKNPIAILKKGDTLALGNGKIEIYLGKSYFDKKTPIDYDNVRYKFTKVECAQ